jgi:hypothetical protein
MQEDDFIFIESFYRYGYKGVEMVASRAPFSMASETEIVGRKLSIDGRFFTVTGVGRQISGPVQNGEPLGLAIELLDPLG